MPELTPDSPISQIHGIGKVREASFMQMGIFKLSDLLFRFPRAYENRGWVQELHSAKNGDTCSFILTIGSSPQNARLPHRMVLTKFKAFDRSGSANITFFNQPYLKDYFKVGENYRFYGKLTVKRTGYFLTSPKYEKVIPGQDLPPFFPVYSLKVGITPKIYATAVEAALRVALPHVHDYLPTELRLRENLPSLISAIRGLHQPESKEELDRATKRMSFDEFFLLNLCTSVEKNTRKSFSAPRFNDLDFTPILSKLPYRLTDAQMRVCREITSDLSGKVVSSMNRILIGDVGCGKTVCAAISIYLCMKNGFQAALMAPTEILARQHYRELSVLFGSLGFHVELLLGATSQKEKNRIYASLEDTSSAKTQLVIGTHALLSEKVNFSSLALTVTDEQHRFGVLQRAALRKKEQESHLLVMSATPIPRTLALCMYGDLSVSKIDEMPPGRQRVSTFVVDDSYRERMYGFIRQEVKSGGQVYIVCPAIEEKDAEDGEITLSDILKADSFPPMKCATNLYKKLSHSVFPDIPIGFLHGKMKPADKNEAMQKFITGETKILVSTTVIEVGVNVPSASLMIVENAERFGLSQLHQLRGRVGRGNRKSYCILVSDSKNETSKERLETMHTTYDGYLIAEADLKQRGPGDFFSSQDSPSFRQSGDSSLHFASLSDLSLMKTAFSEAKTLIENDPALEKSENEPLRKKVLEVLKANMGTVS